MKRWFLTLLTGALIVRTFQEWMDRKAEERAERQKLKQVLNVVRRAHESGEGDVAQRFREAQR